MGRGGGQAEASTNAMVKRAVEAALVWEEMGTREGAEAALTVAGRLLAENPLSVEALHVRGVALHLLGRWVGRAPRGGVWKRNRFFPCVSRFSSGVVVRPQVPETAALSPV